MAENFSIEHSRTKITEVKKATVYKGLQTI